MNWRLIFIFVFPLVSCQNDYVSAPLENRPVAKRTIAIDHLVDQTIHMNSQCVPIRLAAYGRAAGGRMSFSFRSSDTSLVDTSSFVLEKRADAYTLTIYPRLGRSGNARISLGAGSNGTWLSGSFMLNVVRSDANLQYPTVMRKLSPSDLSARQSALHQMLGTSLAAALDDFGLISSGGTLPRGQSVITNPDQAVSIAKTSLRQLSVFSNVTDTSSLSVESVTNNDGSSPHVFTDWAIVFRNQSYQGIEVWRTGIIVLVTDVVTAMYGHQYGAVFVPRNDLADRERAKRATVGKVISYYCRTAAQVTITDTLITTANMSYCIYPLLKGDSLELRLTWKIPVAAWPGDPTLWYYFLDALTGETIAVVQLFIC